MTGDDFKTTCERLSPLFEGTTCDDTALLIFQ